MKPEEDVDMDMESMEPMEASFDFTKVKQKNARHSSIPDTTYDVREHFGIDIDMEVPGFKEAHPNTPTVDPSYQFDPDTTVAILAGFAHEARVMVQGYHGTGKSTHIELIAARL